MHHEERSTTDREDPTTIDEEFPMRLQSTAYSDSASASAASAVSVYALETVVDAV
jgi:hypothetical protein